MLYSSDPQEAKRKEWRRQHRRWYDAYARLLAAGVPMDKLAATLPGFDVESLAGLTCGAHSRQTGKPCRLVALFAGCRCRFHGGLSTGPKTAAGKATVTANLKPRQARS